MENMNNQGKTPQQRKDSTRFTFGGIVGIILLTFFMLFSGCYAQTYHLTDSEYSDAREEHASITYYDEDGLGMVYWGWYKGFYYYYGIPHYYPWYFYYNACPPSHYTHTTHIIISKPVNRPTHRPNRPNRPKVNTHRSNIKVKTNVNRNIKVKTNVNRNKVIIKSNRSNNSNKTRVKTRRNPR